MNSCQLHVWFISLTDPVEGISEAQMLDCLSQDERQRQAGFTHAKAGRANLVSRAMLRHVLSRHSDLAPHQWRFVTGEQGKPALCEQQTRQFGLGFNVSHSGDWLCIAVIEGIGVVKGAADQREIGVDIERFRRGVSVDSVLNRFFAPDESASLMAMPTALREQRFFDLWALKESFIKATGQGLARALDSFSYEISTLDGGAKIAVDTSADPRLQPGSGGVAWEFVALSGSHTHNFSSRFVRLTDEYRVALTCSASLDELPVVCRFW
ncbi:4'-phosphopantetheinyl transferase superfamily protein [Shewanella submarina]|uniref:4'-phosphopantetheinyl transferase family protein n=1 Tax=Shewanella submarina TaxID=2016376 RepID=A0ABV7GNF8_9GAMM|nr:4'-phosphopantetheinyl transferase superfamily protein [Shewanella submarina]MCL1036339.1 4'-phosphopantetheinyl transferase superfamily protein [Shewanella submarina]